MTDTHADQENRDPDAVPLKDPEPMEYTDYLSHQVAEKAKKQVMAYFGVLGILITVLTTGQKICSIKASEVAQHKIVN